MENEKNNLGFNTILYIFSIKGFTTEWPSTNAVEDPHTIIVKGFTADGVDAGSGEVGDVILGADGSMKCINKNGLRDFTFNLFPNTNAFEDIKHYFNRTQVALGEKRIGQVSVQLQIIRTNVKTMECYDGMFIELGGMGGATRDDGQQSITFSFRTTIKSALTKKLTDEELNSYGAYGY